MDYPKVAIVGGGQCQKARYAHITGQIRHFEDLRTGTHGGSVSRKDKETYFERAVQLLAPIARQVLSEMNMSLLLDTGKLTETGLQRREDGGLNASWALSWPKQRAAEVQPITLQAHFLEVASITLIFEARQFRIGR